MKTKIPFLISLTLIVMVAGSVWMGIQWLPDVLVYMAQFLPDAPLCWLCGLIAVPFFAILLAAFAFPVAVARDSVFSPQTAKLLHIIAITLLIDCLAFAAVALWLLRSGEALLSPVLLFVALIGMTIALMLSILARYVDRAAALKEEADGTL